MSDLLVVKKEAVLKAAETSHMAKEILEELFPEAFTPFGKKVQVGEIWECSEDPQNLYITTRVVKDGVSCLQLTSTSTGNRWSGMILEGRDFVPNDSPFWGHTGGQAWKRLGKASDFKLTRVMR